MHNVTDSTTMKYSKLVKSGNREDNDDNEDSEQVMQQQRSYDMPSDDETDDDESEESEEAEESEEESDEAEAEAKAEAYPVAAKTNKNARVDVINVDDIWTEPGHGLGQYNKLI